MTRIYRSICSRGLIHASKLRKYRNARALAMILVIALLVTSLPASAGTSSRAFAATRQQRSFVSQLYSDLGTKLASIGSWVREIVRPKPVVSRPYVPVTAYLNPAPPFISEPTNLSVTSASSSGISLSWTPPAGGADHYQVERSENISGPFSFIGNASGATYNDAAVTNLHAYLYRVRAVSAVGAVSMPSNMGLGTAISFEFQELDNQVIKSQHFHDVRTAINKVRALAGMPDYSWARGDLANLTIKADDMAEMRTALNDALDILFIPLTAYQDPTLTIGFTQIIATHLEQLQVRSTRGASTSTGPMDADSSSARVDAMNETGGGGENPLSRNFNWNLPLVSLAGRAGMDLGLSLSYNSLVWTKIGSSTISFDDDNGFPAPGFRLGFPVIQPSYLNTEVGKNAFLLIGSDGSRTELRQVNTSTLYESADSSHMLFDTNSLALSLTDGTQLTYELRGGEYKCAKIKDRNGNYLTISHGQTGRLDTITDTLNRVLTFNYDSTGLLTSITQQWNQSTSNDTHYWARFEYANKTLDINFPGFTVLGAADGADIKTLTRVKLADNSYFDFTYTSWGQLFKISSYAPDNHLLNYRFYNLPQAAETGHSDCPRFTERRDWAQYWNGNTGLAPVPSEEALTMFEVPVSDTWTMPNTTQKSGMRAQVTAPDGTSNKIYFISSPGWQRGLTALVDTYPRGSSTPARRSMTTWAQDNMTASYPLNPRVTETNIYDDAGNRARTEITYHQFPFTNGTTCHLPEDTYEYAGDAITKLRSTRTLYNTSTSYTDRNILGLVSERLLYQGIISSANLLSRVAFFYDNENGVISISGTDAPVQHDNANYCATCVTPRANLSSAVRYDVTNPSSTTTITSKYNTAGALVWSRDASNHVITIDYTDSFSDGSTTRNTVAYPTTATNADLISAKATYNFDFGALTSRRSPQPNVEYDAPGPEEILTYDSIGRLQQISNSVNSFYTRYTYPESQIERENYSTIQDGLGEVRSFKVTDGNGRVVAAATEHPGSQGGYSGQKFVYDVMGRVIKTSNRTETHASGSPSQWDTPGDDPSWIYTEQTYDWNGRPLIITNPSMTTNPAQTTTQQVSYSTCGCAGNQVITLTDERGRKQKVYSDVLGRTVKTEVLNWNGTVYSTTVNVYDARDLVTQIIQYAGVEGSTTYQTTTNTYDGFARLQSQHTPQQNAGTATTWTYDADDTVHSVTDARGASQTFDYNNRHLPTGITYAAPSGSGISAPAHVTLGYDGAGNRILMNDGFGDHEYHYDLLSRMTEETRDLPVGSGSFSIGYSYNLAGQLTGLTDPAGASFMFTRNSQGQLKAITGSPFAGVTNYVSDVKYRAWGAPKSVTYASTSSTIAYNGRLLPKEFRLTVNSTGASSISENYGYYNDGSLAIVTDLDDTGGISPPSTLRFLSRAFSYDQVGRVSQSNGVGIGTMPGVPYSQSYSYDEFGNMTNRSGSYYNWNNSASPTSDTATYVNNRRTGWTYDANGQVTFSPASGSDLARSMTYDAAGNLTSTVDTGSSGTTTYTAAYDGDGEVVFETNAQSGTTKSLYAIRSTVLGEVLTRLDQAGNKTDTHVPTFGLLIARQVIGSGFSTVVVRNANPVGTTETGRNVIDPLGNYFPLQSYGSPPPAAGSYSSASLSGLSVSLANPQGYANGCLLDGSPVNCNLARQLRNNGSAERCPENDCGPRVVNGELRPLVLVEGGFAVWATEKRKPPRMKFSVPSEVAARKKYKKEHGNDPYNVGKDEKSKFNIGVIRTLVTATLLEWQCREFYMTILRAVAKTQKKNPALQNGDLLSIFEQFLIDGSYTRDEPKELTAPANGAASGLLEGPERAEIYVNDIGYDRNYGDAVNTIAELFHLAGSKALFDDQALADAVHNNTRYNKFESLLKPQANIYSKQYTRPQKESKISAYSNYFHTIQIHICNVKSTAGFSGIH